MLFQDRLQEAETRKNDAYAKYKDALENYNACMEEIEKKSADIPGYNAKDKIDDAMIYLEEKENWRMIHSDANRDTANWRNMINYNTRLYNDMASMYAMYIAGKTMKRDLKVNIRKDQVENMWSDIQKRADEAHTNMNKTFSSIEQHRNNINQEKHPMRDKLHQDISERLARGRKSRETAPGPDEPVAEQTAERTAEFTNV